MGTFRSKLRVFFLLDKRPSRFVRHLRRARKWRAKHPGIPCHTCGYDLGNEQQLATCPECGKAINWNPEWYEDGYLQKRGMVRSGLIFPIYLSIFIAVLEIPVIFILEVTTNPSLTYIPVFVGFMIVLVIMTKVLSSKETLKYLASRVNTRSYMHMFKRNMYSLKYAILSGIILIATLYLIFETVRIYSY